MRTARAFRAGLHGGRKWVQGRVVGEGNEASMMAEKRARGRHSSSVCCSVGIRRIIGVLLGVLRRVHICSWRWGALLHLVSRSRVCCRSGLV